MISTKDIFKTYKEPCPECGDWGIRLFNIYEDTKKIYFDAQCDECGEIWSDYVDKD